MSNNLVQAKVKIKGTRPLFWHKFGRDAIPLEKEEKLGVAGNNPEEWRKTIIVDKEGHFYLEPSYVFATIRNGAVYTKKGRGSIQTNIIATLQIVDRRVYIDRWFPGYPNGKVFDPMKELPPPEDSDEPIYLDVRYAVNPSTRKANVRYRVASSPGWNCEFIIQWDKTIVSRAEMEAVVIDAGNLVGIGNARKIGMGRFDIISFEMIE